MGWDGKKTHTLLHRLDILETNADPPRAAQMPPGLARQVLHHDVAEDHELRVDAVQDAVVGQVEAVGDFDGEPGCGRFNRISHRSVSNVFLHQHRPSIIGRGVFFFWEEWIWDTIRPRGFFPLTKVLVGC